MYTYLNTQMDSLRVLFVIEKLLTKKSLQYFKKCSFLGGLVINFLH